MTSSLSSQAQRHQLCGCCDKCVAKTMPSHNRGRSIRPLRMLLVVAVLASQLLSCTNALYLPSTGSTGGVASPSSPPTVPVLNPNVLVGSYSNNIVIENPRKTARKSIKQAKAARKTNSKASSTTTISKSSPQKSSTEKEETEGEALPESVLDFYNDDNNSGDSSSSQSTTTTARQQQLPSSPALQWVNSLDATSIATAGTFTPTRPFSLLTWNILAESLYRQKEFDWKDERLEWLVEHLKQANADIVCLQEVDSMETYRDDILPRMQALGYNGTVQGDTSQVYEIKRRKGKSTRAHLVATFWKTNRFRPLQVLTETVGPHVNPNQLNKKTNDDSDKPHLAAHMARGRTMTSLLQDISVLSSSDDDDEDSINNNGATGDKKVSSTQTLPTLAVINCHLEGHPRQYAARIRQVQHAMNDLSKRATPPPPADRQNINARNTNPGFAMHGLVICGDFNCELQSSACSTYLRMGRVGRKGGLGGVHGTSAMALPPSLLESQEALEILSPVLEWGLAIPNDEMEQVQPHPFRRNSMSSAYPTSLQAQDCFTYCANPHRPVAGLDQLWYSGGSLTRRALKRPLPTKVLSRQVLSQGLPMEGYPSDHLPIGSILEWRLEDEKQLASRNKGKQSNKKKRNEETTLSFRELIIAQDQELPPPKPKSPIMAYAELDMLLVTLPYDTEEQRQIVEDLIDDSDKVQVPPNGQKPSPEQLAALRDIRDRKQALFSTASETSKPMLQRVFKLKKQVTAYEQEFFGF